MYFNCRRKVQQTLLHTGRSHILSARCACLNSGTSSGTCAMKPVQLKLLIHIKSSFNHNIITEKTVIIDFVLNDVKYNEVNVMGSRKRQIYVPLTRKQFEINDYIYGIFDKT